MKLEYATKNKNQVNDLPKLQALLAPHSIILDAEYLTIMEQAEEGDLPSVLEMAELFLQGTNAFEPNYELLTRYAYKALEITKSELNDIIAVLETYNDLIMIEAGFGHYDKSKALLKEAINVAVEDFHYEDVVGFLHTALVNIVDNSTYEEEESVE